MRNIINFLLVVALTVSTLSITALAQTPEAYGDVGILAGMAILWTAIAVINVIIFILVLIDILKAKNAASWKVTWLIVVLILGIIGLLLYWFIGRKKKV
ncbi:MAG: PLDc N-terminal domain-containing protein [Candidatus Aenigmatarchaeota archaeon]